MFQTKQQACLLIKINPVKLIVSITTIQKTMHTQSGDIFERQKKLMLASLRCSVMFDVNHVTHNFPGPMIES